MSATNKVPIIALPLSFVLIVNGLKDAYEDWRRYKADCLENQQPTFRVCLASPSALANDRALHTSELESWEAAAASPAPPTAVWVDNEEEDLAVAFSAVLMEQQKEVMGDDFDALQQLHEPLQKEHPKKLSLSCFSQKGFIEDINWRSVAVGDLLLIRNWERFPAGTRNVLGIRYSVVA